MKFQKLPILMLILIPFLVFAVDQATQIEPGAINGRVYCDHNKNGVCDCDDDGLKDIHIQIFTEYCGGTALQTIHTDKQGNFSFHVPLPGAYFVMADLDYVCGGRVPTTKTCHEVEMAAGETVTVPPFGYSEHGQ
jgi:hypothetical protein